MVVLYNAFLCPGWKSWNNLWFKASSILRCWKSFNFRLSRCLLRQMVNLIQNAEYEFINALVCFQYTRFESWNSQKFLIISLIKSDGIKTCQVNSITVRTKFKRTVLNDVVNVFVIALYVEADENAEADKKAAIYRITIRIG